MSSSIRKTKAIASLKFKMLIRNTSAITGPLMAIGMTVVMNILYSKMSEGNLDVAKSLQLMALNLGLSINIGMGAVMMTALPLAEDKEKFTLRSLMTSSVTDKQFLIGSIIPPLLATVVTNYILVMVSGVGFEGIDLIMFSFMTIIGSMTSCLIGLLIGIIAKSQVNANNIMMPFIMILSFIPMFATFSPKVDKLSEFVYTGMISHMMGAFAMNEVYDLEIYQLIILFVGLFVFLLLFTFYYRKNILESE